jgi:hypothetical protein
MPAAHILKNGIVVVHISDLHINDNLHNNSFPYGSPAGYYGHDTILVQALLNSFQDVRKLTGLLSHEPLRLVVSGDQTSAGIWQEFTNAHTVLGRVVPTAGMGFLPASALTGGPLFPPFAPLIQVPGNHDQWDGHRLRMYRFNPFLTGNVFERFPWRRIWTSGTLEVDVWGLDSNAGTDPLPFGNWNILAIGSLDPNHLNDIRNALAGQPHPPADKALVRVLVVHHSPSYSGSTLHLHQNSLTSLLQLVANCKFQVLLTGHIHSFDRDHNLPVPGGGSVWELRSASTLQGPATRRNPKPGFLVHKIWADDQLAAHWHTWRYVYAFPKFIPACAPGPDWMILP